MGITSTTIWFDFEIPLFFKNFISAAAGPLYPGILNPIHMDILAVPLDTSDGFRHVTCGHMYPEVKEPGFIDEKLLAYEKILLDYNYTFFEGMKQTSWSDCVFKLAEFRSKAIQLKQHKFIHCRIWGETPLYLPNTINEVSKQRYFREFISGRQTYAPIINMGFFLGPDQSDITSFHLTIHGHAWSFYTSKYDDDMEEWILKKDTASSLANAKYLTSHIAEFLNKCGSPAFKWSMENERHLPSLSGFLPDEMTKLLGKADHLDL